MLTPFVAVFCSLVVISWGAVCTPDQWEAQVFRFYINVDLAKGKVTKVAKIRINTAWDYTNKRISQIMYYDPDSTPYEHNLYIYNETAKYTFSYTIDLLKNKCISMVFPGWGPRYCIPDDARYLGTTTYGLDEVFETQVYNETTVADGYCKSTVKKVDKDTFAPVFDIFYFGNAKELTTETMATYDMTRGIKNTTVFDVPKICEQAVPKQMELPMPQHPFRARFARLHRDW